MVADAVSILVDERMRRPPMRPFLEKVVDLVLVMILKPHAVVPVVPRRGLVPVVADAIAVFVYDSRAVPGGASVLGIVANAIPVFVNKGMTKGSRSRRISLRGKQTGFVQSTAIMR
jgi:hypothetical protein